MASGESAQLSINGKTIGAVGYGLLSLTNPYNNVDRDEAIEIMKLALQQGANFWNGGVFYGTPEYNSLQLVKAYFDKYPEDANKVVLSIKGLFNMATGQPDGSPEAIRAEIEHANKVLAGTKFIDVYQMARIDPKVPVEVSMAAFAEQVKAGKIGGVGLSEANAKSIRKAHAVHPVAAVESELSIMTPDAIKAGILDTCRELGITTVAYSPIGRGWLTGSINKAEDLPKDDPRRRLPRFQAAALDQNIKLAQAVQEFAKKKGVSPAQVAIAWVVAQGSVPIPGSRSTTRVKENLTLVKLSKEEVDELTALSIALPAAGERYGGEHEKLLAF